MPGLILRSYAPADRNYVVKQSHSMMMGIILGALNGIITGAVFIALVKGLAGTDSGQSGKVVGEVLAIPTFWFGGPWVATQTLRSVDWPRQIEPYAAALLVVFALISVFPVIGFVRKVTRDLEK